MPSISEQRKEILRVLEGAGPTGLSPSEVARALGKSPKNVMQLMLTMHDADQIERAGDFRYRIPCLQGSNADRPELRSAGYRPEGDGRSAPPEAGPGREGSGMVGGA